MLISLAKYKFYFLFLLLLIITSAVLVSKMTYMSKDLFDSVGSIGGRSSVLKIFATIFIIWIIDRVIQISKSVYQIFIIKMIKIDIKNTIFSNMMNSCLSSFIKKDSGEYISLLSNDITILEGRYHYNILGLISDIVTIVVLSTSFFILQKTIAMSMFVFAIFALVIPALFSKYTNNKNLEYSNKFAVFLQKVKEYVIGFPTFKNYSVEDKIISRFMDENTLVEEAKYEAEYALVFTNQIGSFFSWFIQFVSVGVGLSLVLSGKTTLGTVVASFSFASALGSPLQTIISRINSIRSVKSVMMKINSILVPEKSINSVSQALCGDITYNSVTLILDNKTIIDSFSFTFERGKKYLIIGRNGSGKSSLFGLINSLHSQYSGLITIGDYDIRDLKSNQISEYLSYLRENVSFLSETVKNNITLFRDNSESELQTALDLAKINIGIEREIDDEGKNISSGEQRRIEIARSLLHSTEVLVFDEVISTLDIETAYEIEDLALSFSDKTIIFISHNFSGKLLKLYDSILLMSDGRLIAHGNYYDLIQSGNENFKKICEIKGLDI